MPQAQFVNPYAQMLADLRARQEALDKEPVTQMHSPEEQVARQTQLARQRAYGQVGMISGDEAVQGVARPMLAEAIKAAEKRQTDHGEYDPVTGQFKYFPEYQKARKQERLDKSVETAHKESADAERRWNEQQQRATDARALRQTLAAMRPPADPGSLTYAGDHPDTGIPVLLHSKRGLQYEGKPYEGKVTRSQRSTEEGSLSYAGTDLSTGNPILLHSKKGFVNGVDMSPHRGPVGEKPQGQTAGEREELSNLVTNIQGMQSTITKLDEAKAKGAGTFTGIIPGYISELHPALQATVTSFKSDEEKTSALMSAYISDGIRAGRFGLTLTPQEKASSVQYLPSAYDNIDELKRKNEALMGLLTKDYRNRVGSMSRPGLPPPGGQIPGAPGAAPGMVPPPVQPGAGRAPAPVTITPPAAPAAPALPAGFKYLGPEKP